VRISTTTLESFRLFEQPDTEWMTEDELIATIRGYFVPNRKVLVGQAFGSILERPERFKVPGGYSVLPRGGTSTISFGDEVLAEPLALIDRPNTVFEARGVKRYAGHDVVAKADQLVGARIIETKTTLGSFDYDKYADSCQWRFMADMLHATYVTYRVFVLAESEANGVISLKSIESFNLFPYKELHQDCCVLVTRFVDYVRAKGLDGILDQRQVEAA
jgi:hypothetical protein